MKVAFIGNTCNGLFCIAEAVRNADRTIDAHLYLPDNVDFQQLPESQNPALRNNYPDWIHKGTEWRATNAYRFWSDNLIRELRKYDVVVVSDLFVSLIPFLKETKTVFLTSGSDLTALPFYEVSSAYLKPTTLKQKLKLRILSLTQPPGIEAADEIWTQPFSPFLDSLDRLRLRKERIKDNKAYLVIDTDLFRPRDDDELLHLPFYKEIREKFDFTVFHPSRLMFDTPSDLSFAHSKNNALLLYGFADFVKACKAVNAGLVLIDRLYSQDVAKTKEIIKELGIEQNVFWLEPPSAGGFPRSVLAQYYSMFSCAADDFGAGWFGSVGLEALSSAIPLISYVDETAMKKLYDWHPFCSTNTVEGISQTLYELYSDPRKRDEIGTRSRQWIEQYHTKEVLGAFYAEQLNGLAVARRP